MLICTSLIMTEVGHVSNFHKACVFLFFFPSFFSVTALLYLEDSRRSILGAERGGACQCAEGPGRERESARALGSSFYMFSSPGPVCSTWSPHSGPQTFLWPSSVLFLRAFLFLVFQPPSFWTTFPYSTYLAFPPQEVGGPILWE